MRTLSFYRGAKGVGVGGEGSCIILRSGTRSPSRSFAFFTFFFLLLLTYPCVLTPSLPGPLCVSGMMCVHLAGIAFLASLRASMAGKKKKFPSPLTLPFSSHKVIRVNLEMRSVLLLLLLKRLKVAIERFERKLKEKETVGGDRLEEVMEGFFWLLGRAMGENGL